jgi:hypothetical protein
MSNIESGILRTEQSCSDEFLEITYRVQNMIVPNKNVASFFLQDFMT